VPISSDRRESVRQRDEESETDFDRDAFPYHDRMITRAFCFGGGERWIIVLNLTVDQIIVDKLIALDDVQKHRVLAFIEDLRHGMDGERERDIAAAAAQVNIAKEDLELMRQAIEEEFGTIDPDESQ